MTNIKVGMQFFDSYSGVHTITGVEDEYIFHSYYDDNKRLVEGACMVRSVFESLVERDVFWVVNNGGQDNE